MNSDDPFNRKNGRNLGAFDQPHQLRFTMQYQVPTLRDSGIALFQIRSPPISLRLGNRHVSELPERGVIARPSATAPYRSASFWAMDRAAHS